MMHRVVSHFIRTTGRNSHYLVIHGSGRSAELVMSCFGLNVSGVWIAARMRAHTRTGKKGGKNTPSSSEGQTSTPGRCNERECVCTLVPPPSTHTHTTPPRIFKFQSDPPLIGHPSSGRLFQPGALTPQQLATSINLAFNNPSLIKAPAVGAAVACV